MSDACAASTISSTTTGFADPDARGLAHAVQQGHPLLSFLLPETRQLALDRRRLGAAGRDRCCSRTERPRGVSGWR